MQDSEGLGASQHAGKMQGGEPVKCQPQQELKPKPRVTLKQQSEQQHEPKPNPTPTPTRRWEIVRPCTQSQTASTGPGPALTSGSSMAEWCLISKGDEGAPLPNKMNQEIGSATNRAQFDQKAPPNIHIINEEKNVKGSIMAITHQNAMAVMALAYHEVVINAARTVDNAVIDV